MKLSPEQRALLVEIIIELEARAEEKKELCMITGDAAPVTNLLEIGRVLNRIIHKSDNGL